MEKVIASLGRGESNEEIVCNKSSLDRADASTREGPFMPISRKRNHDYASFLLSKQFVRDLRRHFTFEVSQQRGERLINLKASTCEDESASFTQHARFI